MARELAAHHWMRAEPLEVSIERLGRLGYDAVEIFDAGERADIRAVGDLLEAAGVACWGGVALCDATQELTSAERDVRRAGVELICRAIDVTARLRGRVVTVVPAPVGKVEPATSAARERKWCIEGLREAGEHAAEAGVRLGVEALNRFEGYLLTTCERVLDVAAVAGDSIGVALDTFHMNIEEDDAAGAIRTAGDRLVDVHVADHNRRPAGEGRLDWPAILRALDDVGYRGCLTAEFAPQPADPTVPLAADDYERLLRSNRDFLRGQTG